MRAKLRELLGRVSDEGLAEKPVPNMELPPGVKLMRHIWIYDEGAGRARCRRCRRIKRNLPGTVFRRNQSCWPKSIVVRDKPREVA